MFEKLSEWIAKQPPIAAKDFYNNPPPYDATNFLTAAHIERLRKRASADLGTDLQFIEDGSPGADGQVLSMGFKYEPGETRRYGCFTENGMALVSLGVLFRIMSGATVKDTSKFYAGVDAPGKLVRSSATACGLDWVPMPLPPPPVDAPMPTNLQPVAPLAGDPGAFTTADRILLRRIAGALGIQF
jgi:hypothetical protein